MLSIRYTISYISDSVFYFIIRAEAKPIWDNYIENSPTFFEYSIFLNN